MEKQINNEKNSAVILIDVQGKLSNAMHNSSELIDNLARLLKGAKALDLPIMWLEQVPDKLGPTVPELSEILVGQEPIIKIAFSACGDEGFMAQLESSGRKNLILCGIESHVCVYQSTRDLLLLGYNVQVVADCVSSRARANHELGLQMVSNNGAGITGYETLLFDMLKSPEHPAFREISGIVK